MTKTNGMNPLDQLVAGAEVAEIERNQLEIENRVLSGLVAGDASLRFSILPRLAKPDAFVDTDARKIAAHCWPFWQTGEYIDDIIFQETFQDKRDEEREAIVERFRTVWSAGQQEPPKTGPVEAYVEVMADRYQIRVAKYAIESAIKQLGSEKKPSEAFRDALDVIHKGDAASVLVGLLNSQKTALPLYLQDLRDNQATEDFVGLDTGFAHLNRIANGLSEGVFVLGAQPSAGKTTLARQVADNVAELNPTAASLFVSFEQSEGELIAKTLSRLSGQNNRNIIRRRLAENTKGFRAVEDAVADYSRFADRVFVIEGDETTTAGAIELAVQQIKQRTGVDKVFVVVDYLQIVATEERFPDPRTKADFLVSTFRRIARRTHSPIMLISALGRTAYNSKDGLLSAFKESGGIEYGADLAGVLVRNSKKGEDGKEITDSGYYKDEERFTEMPFDVIELHIVKNRNGELGTPKYYFYKQISAFKEES